MEASTLGIDLSRWPEMPLPNIEGKLSPVDFAQKWLPVYAGIEWGRRGSRKAAIEMLESLTDYQFNSINNWLSSDDAVPDLVFRYLFVIDAVWEFSNRIESTD